MGDLPTLFDRIETLVAQPVGDDAPTVLLEAMEHTLTDGYAVALTIEAERLRTERAIEESLARAGGANGAEVLVVLSERLAEQKRSLERLREVLDGLKRRLDLVRREADGARF